MKANTVENIKHEPILSWSSDFNYRGSQQENQNLKNWQKLWTKFDSLTTKIELT